AVITQKNDDLSIPICQAKLAVLLIVYDQVAILLAGRLLQNNPCMEKVLFILLHFPLTNRGNVLSHSTFRGSTIDFFKFTLWLFVRDQSPAISDSTIARISAELMRNRPHVINSSSPSHPNSKSCSSPACKPPVPPASLSSWALIRRPQSI